MTTAEGRPVVIFARSRGMDHCQDRARTQLEPRLGADGWAALLDDVRAHLRRYLVDGRLQLPGAVWIATATA